MISLRPGQREVAQYKGGFLAVPAVPGAGKTTVLAYLASQLIGEGRTGQGKVLIVTAMNSAVANFRSRIGDFLESKGLSRGKGYEVRTLHSLAMNILKEKPEALLINTEFSIIDDTTRDQVIREVVQTWANNNTERWQTVIKLDPGKEKTWYQTALANWQQKDLPDFFKEAIGLIKLHGVSPSRAVDMGREIEEDSYLSWALELYKDYSDTLRSNGMLDFDDLIAEAVRLLEEDQGVLERLRKRWTYIFEDEAQDSNFLQEKILRLLSGEQGNLIRVGDSNQAIMGTFTSAEPEIFRAFCRNVQNQGILVSSRSTVQVIDLANYLVHWTRAEHPQIECRSALENQLINPVEEADPYPNPKVAGYTLKVKAYKHEEQEIAEIARLASIHAQKSPENTLAILVPNRYVQQTVVDKLAELGARFEELGKVSNEHAKTINHVTLIINYLAEPQKIDLLLMVFSQVLLPEISQEGIKDLGRLFHRYHPEEIIFPIGGELPWLYLPDEIWDKDLYTQFLAAINRLKAWLDASVQLPPEDLVLFLAEELHLSGEQLEIANNLALMIKQRVSENPTWKLIDIARDLPRIESSLKHFAKIIYELKGFEPQPGVITVLTIHKSKGLEWDTVYLSGITVSEFPTLLTDRFRSELWYLKEELSNPKALVKAQLKLLLGETGMVSPLDKAKLDEISERLRLLYVAITRARKNLLMTYHTVNRFNKKVGPSLVLQALERFTTEEGKRHDG